MSHYSNSALIIEDPPEISKRPLMVYSRVNGPVSMLPDRRPPWKQFLFSMGSQSALVMILLWVGLLRPKVLAPPPMDYRFIRLVNTPHPVNRDPAPISSSKPLPVLELQRPEPLKVPAIAPRVVRRDMLSAPKIEIANKLPAQEVLTVIPKQVVKTNVFSSGSSQVPTIERPPREVQTGGFGDPHGVPSSFNKDRPVTIARQGSFDLPSGGGYGNGSGGQRGVRGVVASGGFGDGLALGDSGARVNTSGPAVSEAGFGVAQPADANQVVSKRVPAAPRIKPAEILSKPVPAYTEEARRLHVEGEVLLEVVFEGSGSIRVVRVVHGLGHGLDESAIKAAQQIRFAPAQKDGQPVDFSGVLHIVFQLA